MAGDIRTKMSDSEFLAQIDPVQKGATMKGHNSRLGALGATAGLTVAMVAIGLMVGANVAAADTTLADCSQSGLQAAINSGGTIDDTCSVITVGSPVTVPAGDTVTLVSDPSVEPAIISGGFTSQVFVVQGNLTLQLMRVYGGYVTGSPAQGGAIAVTGSLTLKGSEVEGAAWGTNGVDATNFTEAGTDGGEAEGGAIYNAGVLRIEGIVDSYGSYVGSTLQGNAYGGYGGAGMGNYLIVDGTVVTGAGTAGGAGGIAAGAAIYNTGALFVTAAQLYGTAQGGEGAEGGNGSDGANGTDGSAAASTGGTGGSGTHGANGDNGGSGGNGGAAEGGVIYNSGNAVFMSSGTDLAGVLIQGQALGGSAGCGGGGGVGGAGGAGGTGGNGLNSDSADLPDGGPGGPGGNGGGGGSGGTGAKAGAGGAAQGGGIYDTGALYLGGVTGGANLAETYPGGCNVDGDTRYLAGGGFPGQNGPGGYGGWGGGGGNGSNGGQGGFGGNGGEGGTSGNQSIGGAGGPGGDADGGFLYSTGTPTIVDSTLPLGTAIASSGSPGGANYSPVYGGHGGPGGGGGNGGGNPRGDGGDGGAGGGGGAGGSGGSGFNAGAGGAGGNADGGIIDATSGLVMSNDVLSGGQVTAGGGQLSIGGGAGGAGGAGGYFGGGGAGGTGDTAAGYANGLTGADGGLGNPGGTGSAGMSGPAGAPGSATNPDVDGSPLASPLSATASLPNATVGASYDAPLEASGGTGPYSWALAFGSLPPGLSLSSAGTISGTPTEAGSVEFTLSVRDSATPAQLTAETVGINVDAVPTASVTLSNLNQTYSGYPEPVTVTTDPAGLPVDVTYNYGTTPPTAVGSYAVVATLAAPGYSGSATGTETISAAPSPVALVVTSSLAIVSGGYAASITVTNSGGSPAVGASLTTATLGSATGSPLPQSLGTIAAGGGSATAVVRFPSSAGAPGALTILRLGGTYSGGTFSSGRRVSLP